MTGHDGGEHDGLAPVIPLFPGAAAAAPGRGAGREGPGWHATWVGDPAPVEETAGGEDDAAERAERSLLRKLRTRSLSEREARAALTDLDLPPREVERILERFVGMGYLDDHALAEQLIDKALSRKAQGRQAIAQTLTQRGIPREIADEALAALPDDESERALEFARSKASQLTDLDADTALRRLMGQLSRRGFGATALDAARQALREQGVSRGPRFR